MDIEAGTGAVGVLIVSLDGGDGVLFHQVADELEEGEALGFGAGVGGVAVGIKATDIGDADALGVVAGAVGADLLNGAARMDTTVGVHDIVIADVVPAEAFMVATDALHGAVGFGAGGGAMDDDFGDLSHCLMGFMGLMGLMGGVAAADAADTVACLFGCDGVATYGTIDGIESIDRIEF